MATCRRFWGEEIPRQLDLFSGEGTALPSEPVSLGWMPLDPARLSDAALIAAIPRASQREAFGLAREAGKRALADAVPALEALCRRFSGFGLDREVTEQMAAIEGLSSTGGKPAAEALTRLIVSGAIGGPGLRAALEAAAKLGCRLPSDRIARFLRDDNPAVREAACRCARGGPDVIPALIDLLADLHSAVSCAAAVALGHLGQREGHAVLTAKLRTAPSEEVINALATIADEDDLVTLGRTAVAHPDLTDVVLQALEESELPRASTVANGIRRRLAS